MVTYNIWNGGADRVPLIERALRELDADCIALEEANDQAVVAALARALGMHTTYGEANSPYAVAWLTRPRPTRTRNHRLPMLEKTLLEVEVDGLRLFCTHLCAGRTVADASRRAAETQAILAVAGQADMLVGDFNAVHPADEIGTPPPEEPVEYVGRRPIALVLDAGFVDTFRALDDAPGWTYLTWKPWVRIDFVFAAPELQRVSSRVVTEAGEASDHFPVVADFAV